MNTADMQNNTTRTPDFTLQRDEDGRVFWVDLARALAMVLILVCHVVGRSMAENNRVFMEMFVGSAALFFMASGAFIFPVRPTPSAFYRRRLAKYLPQFVVWSVVYALLSFYLSPEPYMLKRHIIWILFTPTWPTGWFLYALTGLYLFAPVLSPWLCAASRRQVEWFLGAWAAAGLIPIAMANTDVDIALGIFGPFYNCCGYLVAGYYLSRWHLSTRTRRQNIILLALLLFLGIVFAVKFYFTAVRWGYARAMTNDLSVNVMAMCMLWFILCSMVRNAPRPLKWLVRLVSVNSLGIYLWHMAIYEYIALPTGWNTWAMLTITASLSLMGAVLTRSLLRPFSRILTQKTGKR